MKVLIGFIMLAATGVVFASAFADAIADAPLAFAEAIADAPAAFAEAMADAPAKDKPAAAAKQLVDQVGDLTGYYVCKGAEASGKEYGGIVAIAKVGDVYVVTWCLGGGASFQGLGLRQGESLSVAWNVRKEAGLVQGINVYRIDGKRLVGRWAALPGQPRVQSETLTFLREMEAED